MSKLKLYKPYGIWTVTTEGDCEGRSVSHLGTFEGYIDEIAFALAGKSFYSLRFQPADDLEQIAKPGTKVSVSLDIDSGTWDLHGVNRVDYFKKMLAGRNVSVVEGQYYASVILIDGDSPEEQERKANELKRKQALAKLTEEDRKLLGLGDAS
jgi:hypothetical protein